MGQGILVATVHSKVNLPEHAAKAVAFRSMWNKALGEKGEVRSGRNFTEAGSKTARTFSRAR